MNASSGRNRAGAGTVQPMMDLAQVAEASSKLQGLLEQVF